MSYPLGKSSTDFQSVRDGILSLPLYFDIDLSIARSKSNGSAGIYEVAGNSLFQDQDVAGGGICKITFQHRDFGIADPSFTSAPGFQATVPFTRLVVENAAQSGKTARIFYGVDLDFKPASVGVVQITGGVSIAQANSIIDSNFFTINGTTMLLPDNAARKRIIVRNLSWSPIFIGGSTVGTSSGAIRLGSGEMWVEDTAAAAKWFCYCGTAGQELYIQEAY